VVLGRGAGLNEAQIRHIGDDPLPEGIYDPVEAAIVTYAQWSTRMEPIDDELHARLRAHLSTRQVMDLCFTVGLSNLINRFHATFLTDVDTETGEVVGPACPMPMPEELRRRAEGGDTG
jgi:alkylhydroperoxidase family enzyme